MSHCISYLLVNKCVCVCVCVYIVTMAVSVAIFCEIFSVKEWCDLENSVRVRSKSLEMAPFHRSRTVFYSSSIVWPRLISFSK